MKPAAGLVLPHIVKGGRDMRGRTDHEGRWSVLPGCIIQMSKIAWGRLNGRHRISLGYATKKSSHTTVKAARIETCAWDLAPKSMACEVLSPIHCAAGITGDGRPEAVRQAKGGGARTGSCRLISFGVVSGPRLNEQVGLLCGQPNLAVSPSRIFPIRHVSDAVVIA